MRKNLKKVDPKLRLRRSLADHPRWAWIESTPWGRRLAPFIYVFYWDRRAFYTLAATGAMSALAIVATSPLFRTVPKEIEAPRISLIDWIQAQTLARTARKAQESNQPEVARLAWRTAIANNSGDIRNLRSYLEFELSQSKLGVSEISDPQCVLANWILMLDPDDPESHSIALRVFEAGRQFETLRNHIAEQEFDLREFREIKARALFFQGEMAQFREETRDWETDDPANRELRTLLLARDAMWGRRDERAKALSRLNELSQQEDESELAHRALLRAHFSRRDIDRYSKSLTALSELGTDRLEEHIALWDLLSGFGRGVEAQRLALQYSRPPSRVSEAAKMVLAYMGLGLVEEPLPYLQRYQDDFATSGPYQALLALELIRNESWDALIAHTVSMRSLFPNSTPYLNFANLSEAIAQEGKGYEPLADRALERLRGENEFPSDALTSLAELLVAQRRLRSFEMVIERMSLTDIDPSVYWSFQAQLAEWRNDADLGYHSARELYDLSPSNPTHARNYMVAEFYQRQQPAKALALCRSLRDTYPSSIALRPLHAFALAINGRLPEATEILAKVSSGTLSEEDAVWYRLAEMEIHITSANWKRAQKISSETTPRDLFQVAIYKRQLSRIESAIKDPKSSVPNEIAGI